MATSKTISISRAQAEAARLPVETADKWGEPAPGSPAGVRAMARSLNGTTITKNDLNGTTTTKNEKPA